MNNLKLLIVFLSVVSLFACNKDEIVVLEPSEVCSEEVTIKEKVVFIFGRYAGECFGDQCIITYKFSSDGLYEDMNDPYQGNGEFDFSTKLSQENFELAKCLYAEIPTDLLEEPSQTFGCPDCGDAGGLYVQWEENGQVFVWNIDIFEDMIPSYLHEFVVRVGDTIRAING